MSNDIKSIGLRKRIFINLIISLLLLPIVICVPAGIFLKLTGGIGFWWMLASFIPAFISVSIYLFFFKNYIVKRLKYYPCPYCGQSIKTWEKWVCDYCDHTQPEPHFISNGCMECSRYLKSAFCEHCHKEFLI
ncbi:hypothetical protein [Desulfatibacillum aliphaticivorans]|uniref:hypothetical protein n=1 Tax=Desulfatibacillum aliphaticivorans TaxID=218208 RepID=UPI0012F9890F|nr:hypothetical protein [Desulfatibacillum aliphaticivorans]